MAAPSTSDYELLTEHFSYPPVTLLDDIINTVNVLADRALDSVERLLLSIPPENIGFTAKTPPNPKKSKSASNDLSPPLPPNEAFKFEIENGTHQLETLLNASIDKNFDLFELYVMKNILTVQPEDQPYIRLSHYDSLDFAANAQQSDRPTTESITALRRRLQSSQRLHLALETERTRNDALLRKLKAVLGKPDSSAAGEVKKEEQGATESPSTPFAFLRNKNGLEGGGSEKPITTTTEFTLSQLQALRSLSTSLRTILPGLESAADATGDGDSADSAAGKSWRRERAEYVETSSRKYLERSTGLELLPGGEVRDGEWQGGGRSIKKNEVEGLEKVVAILQRGSGDVTAPSSEAAKGRGDNSGDAMDES